MAQAEQPDSYDDELARIDASIADLKIRDMAAAKERTQIASKIQAAQFQRDILAHANSKKKAKKTAKRQRPRRTDYGPPAHTAGPPPEWSAPGTPATGPQGGLRQPAHVGRIRGGRRRCSVSSARCWR